MIPEWQGIKPPSEYHQSAIITTEGLLTSLQQTLSIR